MPDQNSVKRRAMKYRPRDVQPGQPSPGYEDAVGKSVYGSHKVKKQGPPPKQQPFIPRDTPAPKPKSQAYSSIIKKAPAVSSFSKGKKGPAASSFSKSESSSVDTGDRLAEEGKNNSRSLRPPLGTLKRRQTRYSFPREGTV